MKKFLTVLLVIAVMFTFSFGSAFAAALTAGQTDEFNTAVDNYKESLKYVKGTDYLAVDVEGAPGWNDVIHQTVLEAAIDEWAADVTDLTTISVDGTGEDVILDSATQGAMVTAITQNVLDGQIDFEIKNMQTKIDEVRSSLSNYNTTGQTALTTAIGTAETAITTAQGKAAAANTVVGDVTDLTDAIDDLKDAVKTNEIYLLTKDSETLAQQVAILRTALNGLSDTYYDAIQNKTTGWFATNTNLTTAQNAAKATFDADFNSLVDYFDECIDKYYDEKSAGIAAGSLTIASHTALNTQMEKYFEKAAIEGAGVTSPVDDTKTFQKAKKFLAERDVWVAYYEKEAAKAKAELKADGTKKYYDADVDRLLADTKAAVDKDLWTAISTDTWGVAAKSAWNLLAIATNNFNLQDYRDAAIDKFTTDGIAGNYDLDNNWVGSRADKVEAIQEDYAEKILLAETVIDIDALVKEAQTAINAIMTMSEVDAVANRVASRIEAAKYLNNCDVLTAGDDSGYGVVGTATGGNLDSYFNVVVGSSTTHKKEIKDDALKAAAQVFVDAVLEQENKNITYKQIDEIIAANREAAYTALTNVKTTAELNAEAAAVAELIKALPSVVTIADKDQVLAAQAAMDAYLENAGAAQKDVKGWETLKNALTIVMNAEAREVNKLIRALPTTVTVADADKIAAARAAYDAFDETYGNYDSDFTSAAYPSAAKLETAEAYLEKAKYENVAKLIEALNANSTKAEIEAAKAAFDELTTKSKLTLNDQLYTKLMNAVSALEGKDIEAVEALKIKASSTVKKGSITVKWTVKGDTTAVEGYEIWKSTKKSSKYSKAFTQVASKQTYKNTKGLKKGTRYYYKVRAIAYDAAGNKVTSDWSNKAYRIAK